MEGTVFIIFITLALLHSCTACTNNEPYACLSTETTTEVTVGWCWDVTKLFRCKEEHPGTKTVSRTCHRTVCCEGYQRSNSWDECKAVCFGSNSCQNGGSCVARDKCICPSGYVSPKCADENECSVKNGGCSHACRNTIGSFHCSCHPGFTLDSNQLTCKAVCFGSNFCQNGGSCVAPDKCICPSGYVSPKCADENECSVKNGGCSHACRNTIGSFHCSCPLGFTLDSNQLTCKAIATTPPTTTPDVCSTDNGGCSHFCVKVNETVRCNCPAQMNLADDNVTCISDRSTPIDKVVPHYHRMAILLCLGSAVLLCFLITLVMLTKRYGWRWSHSCGYRKLPTEEQKVWLIAEEYSNEADENELLIPPPYQEKMDGPDIYI
ncbi:fibrillin-3-like isoform X1 [Mya arenaria]|uniref:fibrillin-3-like isoform X1 n=1 Tax=Mya arenaria TaxID=6604 RepID=UPI0022E53DC1|nr:fibrillin-3-like isoform X1 [Mya arenaria]